MVIKMGNLKLNCHALRIENCHLVPPLPFPSPVEWIWFIIIESNGGSEAGFMV